MSRQLRVLVACEMSGRVRTQFAKRNWDAWSADFLADETEMWNEIASPVSEPIGRHYQGDVMDLIGEDWDLVIAHPPCDRLTNAGARYWKQWQADGSQQSAIEFFWAMYSEPRDSAYVVVENPRNWIGAHQRKPDQIVEPWMFGEPRAKKVCLWYRNVRGDDGYFSESLPRLVPTNVVTPTGRVATGGGSHRTDKAAGRTGVSTEWEDSQGRARRKILRSITSAGVAEAMASQWGEYVEGKRA